MVVIFVYKIQITQGGIGFGCEKLHPGKHNDNA